MTKFPGEWLIDLSAIPKGIYLLRIWNREHQLTERICIQ